MHFTPDGRHLIAIGSRLGSPQAPNSEQGILRAYTVPTGTVAWAWEAKADAAPLGFSTSSLCADAKGKRVVVWTRVKETPSRVIEKNFLLDATTGRPLAELPRLTQVFAFSPNGDEIWGRDTKTLLVVDAASGKTLRSWPIPREFASMTEFLADPVRRRLGLLKRPVPLERSEFVVLNIDTWQEVCRIKPTETESWDGPGNRVWATFGPEGTVLVTGGIQIWEYDSTTARLARRIPVTGSRAQNIDVDAEGRWLVIRLESAITRVLNYKTGTLLTEYRHGFSLGSDSISPTGVHATLFMDHILMRDISQDHRSRAREIPLAPNGRAEKTPDQRYLVVEAPPPNKGGEVQTLKFHDIRTGDVVGELAAPGHIGVYVTYGPGGIVTINDTNFENERTGSCRVYRVGTGPPVLLAERKTGRQGESLSVLAADSTGRVVLQVMTREIDNPPGAKRPTTSERWAVVLWDAAQKKDITLDEDAIKYEVTRPAHALWRATFSPDESQLVVVRGSTLADNAPLTPAPPTIQLNVWTTEKLERRLTTSLVCFSNIFSVTPAFHQSGKWLFVNRAATESPVKTTATLNLSTGQWDDQFWKGDVAIPLAFGPAGRLFVGKTMRPLVMEGIEVWDSESGRQMWKVRGHYGSTAFSPDGTRLAAVRRESGERITDSLVLFDVTTGQELLALPGASMHHVAFDASDQRIISAGWMHNSAGANIHAIRTWDASPLPSAKQR